MSSKLEQMDNEKLLNWQSCMISKGRIFQIVQYVKKHDPRIDGNWPRRRFANDARILQVDSKTMTYSVNNCRAPHFHDVEYTNLVNVWHRGKEYVIAVVGGLESYWCHMTVHMYDVQADTWRSVYFNNTMYSHNRACCADQDNLYVYNTGNSQAQILRMPLD